ncbi:hypothetical protein [Hyphomicrobium sp.]|uniref:hypothetical protein n=1 Tax=Hyphomicrobium sp. TaxID=82 RepID=UPI002E35F934|nr:hypothetical protein [Hyphomicrobium sp.]HEX2841133.1 hypothetical protein [Hyphomicrobium sp.]
MRVKNLGRVLIISAAALVAAGAAAIGEECIDKTAAQHANDYPTVTRADYIYGCMLANGQTRDVLEKCSCSIDVIATALPFKEYEEAETVMSVRQRGGESVAFLYAPAMQEKIKNLKRAQVEGEIRCF